MTKKDILEYVRETILKGVSEINQVSLNRGQLQDPTGSHPLDFPVVLVTFQNLPYKTNTLNTQSCEDGILVLDIADKSYNSDEDEKILDLTEAVAAVMQAKTYERVQDMQDTVAGGISDFKIGFAIPRFTTDLAGFYADYTKHPKPDPKFSEDQA